MPSRKSLIVGASGQVGSQLVRALGRENVILAGRIARPGWEQINLENLSRSTDAVEHLLREHDIGAIYCVGGATNVEQCESEPNWAAETNHIGPAVLASLATGIPFVYFSTEYVFDGLAGPYCENSLPNPISAYGESKARGEEAILDIHPSPLILRTTVVYGEDPGRKNFLYSLRRNLSTGTRMKVPVDQISTPTYNRDLAAASILLAERGCGGIIHVCGPELLSRYEFAVRAADQMGLDSALIDGVRTSELGQKAPRPLNAGLQTSLFEEVLPGFKMRDLAAGLKDWLAAADFLDETR